MANPASGWTYGRRGRHLFSKYDHAGGEYTGPVRHVEMFDAPDGLSEEELVELHNRRVRYSGYNGDLSFLEPADVDELFLYMSRD